jgi:hypothetical protein
MELDHDTSGEQAGTPRTERKTQAIAWSRRWKATDPLLEHICDKSSRMPEQTFSSHLSTACGKIVTVA